MPKTFNFLPKWWNFAKSGHTDIYLPLFHAVNGSSLVAMHCLSITYSLRASPLPTHESLASITNLFKCRKNFSLPVTKTCVGVRLDVRFWRWKSQLDSRSKVINLKLGLKNKNIFSSFLVTRWPNYYFHIWPFTWRNISNLPSSIIFCQSRFEILPYIK